MSDYKVELVNDNMQEFYVEFHGPEDSSHFLIDATTNLLGSSFPGWSVEASC